MVALAVVLCAACGQEPRPWALRVIARDYTFGARDLAGQVLPEGRTVAAAQLERGREAYLSYCACCHGLNGDGRGRCAVELDPPPRDLRAGHFKFGAVRSGELVNDADLVRIVRAGLNGTAMRGWHLRQSELSAVIQYLKTFPAPPCQSSEEESSDSDDCREQLERYPDSGQPSPWQEVYSWGDRKGLPKPTGLPVVLAQDPWQDRRAAAIVEGEALYHLKAECMSCHPAYLTRQQLVGLAQRRGEPKKDESSFRSALSSAVVLRAKDNPYGLDILPTELAHDPLRSIRDDHQLVDFARLVASGVGGLMPAWIDSLTPSEIWALSHYLRSLRVKSDP